MPANARPTTKPLPFNIDVLKDLDDQLGQPKIWTTWIRSKNGGKQPARLYEGKLVARKYKGKVEFQSCEQAYKHYLKGCRNNQQSGIGIICRPEHGVNTVDIGDAFDELGDPKKHTASIVKQFSSYTEVSLSENGLHIIGMDTLNKKVHRRRDMGEGHNEVAVDNGMFMALTGDVFEDHAEATNTELPLRRLHKALGKGKKETERNTNFEVYEPPSIAVALELLQNMHKGGLYETLFKNYKGETQKGSRSEISMRLCSALVYVSGNHIPTALKLCIKSAFNEQTGYYDEKKSAVEHDLIKCVATATDIYKWDIDDLLDDEPSKPKFGLTFFEDVDSKPVDWIWQDYIAKGGLTMIAGEPGVSKGIVVADFVKTISIGGKWADGSLCEQGKVLYLTAEDDPNFALKPRLDVAGADTSQVAFLDLLTLDDGYTNLATDLIEIEKICQSIPDLKMIVIDPINSFLTGGKMDGNSDTDIRNVLTPVSELAKRLNVAIVCVAHFSKATNRKSTHRVMGSTAFVGLPRNVHAVSPNPYLDNDCIVLMPIKANLNKLARGLEYRIRQMEGYFKDAPNPKNRDQVVPYVEWQGESDLNQSNFMDEPDADHAERQQTIAADWIAQNSTGEWQNATDLEEAAIEAGLSRATYKDVRAEMKVDGVIENQKNSESFKWQWRLKEVSVMEEVAEEGEFDDLQF